jgi:hypothetical protein
MQVFALFLEDRVVALADSPRKEVPRAGNRDLRGFCRGKRGKPLTLEIKPVTKEISLWHKKTSRVAGSNTLHFAPSLDLSRLDT